MAKLTREVAYTLSMSEQEAEHLRKLAAHAEVAEHLILALEMGVTELALTAKECASLKAALQNPPSTISCAQYVQSGQLFNILKWEHE